MALKSTIFKAELQIADLDRGHFGDYSLTLARHPSETDERMMVRLLAFALYAESGLSFGKGLSSDDEPALSWVDEGGITRLLIEVGLPEEDRLRKACHRADQVALLVYGRATGVWWRQQEPALARYKKLHIRQLTVEDAQSLAKLAARSMKFSITIQEGVIYFGDTVLNLVVLKHPDSA